ncbi:MAG: A/G-specific adenine glycosylase [Chloroflexota bacterium]
MTRFSSRVLMWYARNARPLPWRIRAEPYRTLVSEVMLQQTRVETVLPYFDRWMARYPSIQELAAASESAVLGLWEGLGYYARARNLLRAARAIVDDFEGQIPSDPSTLRKLPGVGTYTAAAIASIAFGGDEPAVDANIRRVLARVFCVRIEADSRLAEERFLSIAAAHLPRGRAGEFNQALMDLGATVCLPRRPRCGACPVVALCEARKSGVQAQLPLRAGRRGVPHYVVGAAVIRRRDQVLIAKRASKGLLGGLWEFPKTTLGKIPRRPGGVEQRLASVLEGGYALKLRRLEPMAVVQHAYSHFRVTVHAYVCSTRAALRQGGLRWVKVDRLARYPMGKVDRRIAERLQGSGQ